MAPNDHGGTTPTSANANRFPYYQTSQCGYIDGTYSPNTPKNWTLHVHRTENHLAKPTVGCGLRHVILGRYGSGKSMTIYQIV